MYNISDNKIRYADEVEAGDEVLTSESGEMVSAEVVKVSRVTLEGKSQCAK